MPVSKTSDCELQPCIKAGNSLLTSPRQCKKQNKTKQEEEEKKNLFPIVLISCPCESDAVLPCIRKDLSARDATILHKCAREGGKNHQVLILALCSVKSPWRSLALSPHTQERYRRSNSRRPWPNGTRRKGVLALTRGQRPVKESFGGGGEGGTR